MSGLRIIRVATHPNAQGKGYGSRALELLIKYYEGELLDNDNIVTVEGKELFKNNNEESKSADIKNEKLKPKKNLKPILQKLAER